ncbi:hypothetical protein [Neorhodopirellula pilleata]|uniref:Uncharacterized protein n=1 Tax=Neorhodopirellula pilleata TaxID=2714738 RepID=A0A5C6A4V9_9BACT|nr:hypothetical protein [Neorhodopirellula pilleata]TWT95002.1 hypothetical protein Pla100_35810 [Neorhodopirellula pilleata]
MRPRHPAIRFCPDSFAWLGILTFFAAVLLVGCGKPQNSIVEETDAYRYEDVLAQINAEEAASDQAAEE